MIETDPAKMTIVYEYTYKTDDQAWNPGKGQVNNFVSQAWLDWKEKCIETQPGFLSSIAEEDVDSNTRRRGWVIDTLDNALHFWANIHDANNYYYASLKSQTLESNSFIHHDFSVVIENKGTTINIIPRKTANT